MNIRTNWIFPTNLSAQSNTVHTNWFSMNFLRFSFCLLTFSLIYRESLRDVAPTNNIRFKLLCQTNRFSHCQTFIVFHTNNFQKNFFCRGRLKTTAFDIIFIDTNTWKWKCTHTHTSTHTQSHSYNDSFAHYSNVNNNTHTKKNTTQQIWMKFVFFFAWTLLQLCWCLYFFLQLLACYRQYWCLVAITKIKAKK